ncbi:hypothetical protein ACI2KR_29245 [Pseudomonas luteola]
MPHVGYPAIKEGWAETIEYFTRCREAVARVGADVPVWDRQAEERIGTRMAAMLVADRSWVLRFKEKGEPELEGIKRGYKMVNPANRESMAKLIGRIPSDQLLPLMDDIVQRMEDESQKRH